MSCYLYERELLEISKFHANSLMFRINRGDILLESWPREEKGEKGSGVSITPLKIHQSLIQLWNSTWMIHSTLDVFSNLDMYIYSHSYKWTESDKCIINIERTIPFEFICNPNLARDRTRQEQQLLECNVERSFDTIWQANNSVVKIDRDLET